MKTILFSLFSLAFLYAQQANTVLVRIPEVAKPNPSSSNKVTPNYYIRLAEANMNGMYANEYAIVHLPLLAEKEQWEVVAATGIQVVEKYNYPPNFSKPEDYAFILKPTEQGTSTLKIKHSATHEVREYVVWIEGKQEPKWELVGKKVVSEKGTTQSSIVESSKTETKIAEPKAKEEEKPVYSELLPINAVVSPAVAQNFATFHKGVKALRRNTENVLKVGELAAVDVEDLGKGEWKAETQGKVLSLDAQSEFKTEISSQNIHAWRWIAKETGSTEILITFIPAGMEKEEERHRKFLFKVDVR